jgi:predicted hotdog family 3-hydroxylacyl-ACP dehydratase
MGMLDIRSLLPHAGPMVLLDRVVSADAESLCAEVELRAGGLFCTSEGVGGWVGIEYMAQAIGAYAGYTAHLCGEPVKIGFLLGARRYECTRPFFTPGSILKIYVRRILVSDNGLASFECRIDDHGGEVATATLTVFQPADINEFFAGISA